MVIISRRSASQMAWERIFLPSLGWLAMMRTSRSRESCITSRNSQARSELLRRSLTEERMMSSPHVWPRVSTLPLYMASPRCTMLSSPVGTSSLGAKRRICSAREMSLYLLLPRSGCHSPVQVRLNASGSQSCNAVAPEDHAGGGCEHHQFKIQRKGTLCGALTTTVQVLHLACFLSVLVASIQSGTGLVRLNIQT